MVNNIFFAIALVAIYMSLNSRAQELTKYKYVRETPDSYDHSVINLPKDAIIYSNRTICCGHGYCSPSYIEITSKLSNSSSLCCNPTYQLGCKCDSNTPKSYICGTKNCTCTTCKYPKKDYVLAKYQGTSCKLITQRIIQIVYISVVPGIKMPYREYHPNSILVSDSRKLSDRYWVSNIKSTRYYPDMEVSFFEGNINLQILNGSISWLRIGGAAGSREYTDLSGSIRLENVCKREDTKGYISIEYEQNSLHYGPDLLENTPYDVCDHISNCWYCLQRYSCSSGLEAFIVAVVWIAAVSISALGLIFILFWCNKIFHIVTNKCLCCGKMPICCCKSYRDNQYKPANESDKEEFDDDIQSGNRLEMKTHERKNPPLKTRFLMKLGIIKVKPIEESVELVSSPDEPLTNLQRYEALELSQDEIENLENITKHEECSPFGLNNRSQTVRNDRVLRKDNKVKLQYAPREANKFISNSPFSENDSEFKSINRIVDADIKYRDSNFIELSSDPVSTLVRYDEDKFYDYSINNNMVGYQYCYETAVLHSFILGFKRELKLGMTSYEYPSETRDEHTMDVNISTLLPSYNMMTDQYKKFFAVYIARRFDLCCTLDTIFNCKGWRTKNTVQSVIFESKYDWVINYDKNRDNDMLRFYGKSNDSLMNGDNTAIYKARIRENRRQHLFTWIIVVALLLPVCLAESCTDVFGITGETEVCTSNGTEISCLMTGVASLTLPGVGSSACFSLKRQDGSLIQRVVVKMTDYYQKAIYTPAYYTDDYNINFAISKDSGSWGDRDDCNWSICNLIHICNVWGYGDEQSPWRNTICKPGLGKCFMCDYSSIYYMAFIDPGSMALVSTLVTNNFNPIYSITIENSNGESEVTKMLSVGEHFLYNGVTFSRGVETTPQTLNLDQFKLLTFDNKAYLCVASNPTENTIGTIGDVQRTCAKQDPMCLRYNSDLHVDGSPYTCITTLPSEWPLDSINSCSPVFQVTQSGWKTSFKTSCKDITVPININGFSVVAQKDDSNQTFVMVRSPYLVNVNLNIETTIDSTFSMTIQDKTLSRLEATCSGTSGIYGNVEVKYVCKCTHFDDCQVIATNSASESIGFITCDNSEHILNYLSTTESVNEILYASNLHVSISCETPIAFVLPNVTWIGYTITGGGDGSGMSFGNLFGFLDFFGDMSLPAQIGMSILGVIINIAIIVLIIVILVKLVRFCRHNRRTNKQPT